MSVHNPPPGGVYPEPPKPTPAAPTRLLGFPVQIIDTMAAGGFTVGVSCAFCGNTIDGDKCLRVEINNNAKRLPLCDDCFNELTVTGAVFVAACNGLFRQGGEK